MLAFYSSDLDLIIEDSAYMLIPLDDRLINRCHGIFDSMQIKKYRFHRLQQHLDRFQASATKVGIQLPLSIEEIKQKMIELSQFSYIKLQQCSDINLQDINLNMRIWLSSGKGDFGIYSFDKQPIFYCCTFIPNTNVEILNKGVKEYCVQLGEQQENMIKSAKSTNYLENAIIANTSKQKGGYQGLKIDENGNVLEAAMANIGIVLKNQEFWTPPGEKIVEGTTLKKCFQFMKEELIPKKIINQIQIKYFNLDFIFKNAIEVILFGGDKIIPVLSINDIFIGDGNKGVVCENIQKWYINQGGEDEGDEEIDLNMNKEQLLDYKGLISVSGDGLPHEIINGLFKRNDRDEILDYIGLGILPGGSGNAIISSILYQIQEPRTLECAAYQICKGVFHKMDIFKFQCSQNQHFYGVLSVAWSYICDCDLNSEHLRFLSDLRFDVFGVYRAIFQKNYKGKLSFTCQNIDALPPLEQSLENNEDWKHIENEFKYFMLMNTPMITKDYVCAPLCKIDDGFLDLQYVSKNEGWWQFVKFVLKFQSGQHFQKNSGIKFSHQKIKAFRLEDLGSGHGQFSIDGEKYENIPALQPNQVLIKVESAPINPSDLLFIQNKYPHQRKAPCVAGFEGSGTVVKSGGNDIADSLVGKNVSFITTSEQGSYSEYTIVEAQYAIEIKGDISFNQASTSFVNPFTVIGMLQTVQQKNVKAVVHSAAASALGKMFVRYFQKNNIKVINVVRREEQVKELEKEGAEIILNSEKEDFKVKIKELAVKNNATIFFDAVGGKLTGQVLENMPDGSTAYIYGILDQEPVQVSQQEFVFQEKTVTGWWLKKHLAQVGIQGFQFMAQEMQTLLGSLLKTEIQGEFSLNQGNQAIDVYQKNMTKGKVIIKPQLYK
ncbi:zinc-binding dehydrogenase family protein, putative [Ichthyophthirius multifiliis]|uniref:Zinc-binding dehydrogenase family protein, putative n=1 Tax=Ichthyophthirius multifiliis TaxID=5932 RepID=G0QVG8_ICHMU|nr:zinc-binding dehydrogenase family protein, putative [Ichthyophthirius multifiliis]EGR30778.1 zinc-binding dehydrogenase family protein, putative [Ichthyophthirius multifiliis]|eukprot:XP_004032365.1 zinc-binding dehydrogenase family protein, putative [Ichthyophthirius multifiliis]